MSDRWLHDHDYCAPGKKVQWIFPVIECRATTMLRDIVRTFGQYDITFTLLLGDFVASLLMTEWDIFYDDRTKKPYPYPEDRITGMLLDLLSDGIYNHVVHELGVEDESDDDGILDARIESYMEALHMELDTAHAQLVPYYAPYVRRYLDSDGAKTISKITGIEVIGDALIVIGELI